MNKSLAIEATKPLVAILMGSKTDANHMDHCREVLNSLEIPYVARIISAHRTPDEVRDFAQLAEQEGLEIIIAGAGASAALPGVLAAHTMLPVIGVPLNTTSLGGLDALLAISQMPGGIPVATMAIGGAKNAGLFAARILAQKHEVIKSRLKIYIRNAYETAKKNIEIDPFQTDFAS